MAEIGKRSGAPPGDEVKIGGEKLAKIDELTKAAQDTSKTAADRQTAFQDLSTLLNQLQKGTP